MLKYIFFTCLIICSYLFYHWVNQTEKNIQDSIVEALPTFVAHNLKSKIYNQDGYLYEIISAHKAEYYKVINMTDLIHPSLDYIPAKDKNNKNLEANSVNSNEIWRLSADHGVLNNEDSINLRDNVIVTTTNPLSFVQKISSQYLELDFITDEIRTPDRIYIEGNNFKNNGLGFNGNLKTKNFTINEDCHANYSGFTNK